MPETIVLQQFTLFHARTRLLIYTILKIQKPQNNLISPKNYIQHFGFEFTYARNVCLCSFVYPFGSNRQRTQSCK